MILHDTHRRLTGDGGLQSPEVYLGIRAVDGVRPGIYHYDPRGHGLELLSEGDFSGQLGELAFGEEYVREAQMVVLLACPVSGFAQDPAERLLGIDGRSELALLMLTIGVV